MMIGLIAATAKAKAARKRLRQEVVAEINKVLGMNDIADAGAIADRVLSIPAIRSAFGYWREFDDD
jgi:hypothetical protein